MNVEEQIRREYEAGATYRQLAKKYRKNITQIDRSDLTSVKFPMKISKQ